MNAENEITMAEQTAAAEPPRQQRALYSGLLAVSLLGVLGLSIYSGYVYRLMHTVDARSAQQTEQLHATQQALAALQANVNAQTELIQRVSTLEQTINNPQRVDLARRYALYEVQRLLRLAHERLLFAHDVNSALRLLAEADHALQKVEDTRLYALRELLAQHSSELKAVAAIDTIGLYTQLNSLLIQVEQLSFIPSLAFDAQPVSAGIIANNHSRVDGFMTWLNQYIKIANQETQITPLLTPAETTFVKHNIKVLLEQAQWAIWGHHTKAYQDSLARAQQLLKQYGIASNIRVQAFVNALDVLKKQELSPPLPDISASLALLDEILNDNHATVTPAP